MHHTYPPTHTLQDSDQCWACLNASSWDMGQTSKPEANSNQQSQQPWQDLRHRPHGHHNRHKQDLPRLLKLFTVCILLRCVFCIHSFNVTYLWSLDGVNPTVVFCTCVTSSRLLKALKKCLFLQGPAGRQETPGFSSAPLACTPFWNTLFQSFCYATISILRLARAFRLRSLSIPKPTLPFYENSWRQSWIM